MTPQISGFHSRQTASASCIRTPGTISGGFGTYPSMTEVRVLSSRTFHLEKPPIRGDFVENTTLLILLSRTGSEHITQGSTFEYNVQPARRFRPRIRWALEMATNSACRVTSPSRDTWLVTSTTTLPSLQITQANGSSPSRVAILESSIHRAIMSRSSALAVESPPSNDVLILAHRRGAPQRSRKCLAISIVRICVSVDPSFPTSFRNRFSQMPRRAHQRNGYRSLSDDRIRAGNGTSDGRSLQHVRDAADDAAIVSLDTSHIRRQVRFDSLFVVQPKQVSANRSQASFSKRIRIVLSARNR
jgi:hypothetical protein